MTKFTAPTIELALLEASKELKCSIVDLEYEILEKPSKGFLGLGKKDAKIVVSLKNKRHNFGGDLKRESKGDFRGESRGDFKSESKNNDFRGESKFAQKGAFERKYDSKYESKQKYDSHSETKLDSRFESKYETDDIDESIINKIHKEINELFALLPIKLSKIEVAKFEKNTILIHFKGADAALLIGERGYRYKAISYLLFNWLNAEYGINVRLEIESFLASQEAMMAHYLAPIIDELKDSDEPFATKTFDGILAYIALKELRAKLRGKSVVLKTNENDENYILIQPLRK